MKAWVLTGYGGPERLAWREDLARPQAGPGQLLVKVKAAGLNPVDFKIRQGKLKPIRRFPLPAVMGNEIAGVVEAVGPGASGFAVGERVYARLDKDHMGGLAEWAVVHQDHLAHMPATLDFEAAAAVPLAALTALQALRDELRLAPGHRLFIPAGAGGVGCFAIQLARMMGAEVTTTASPRGEPLVRRLGAHQVIDYTRERFETVLPPQDGVFDLLGGEELQRSFAVVKPGGRVVSVAGMPEPETARRDLGRGPGLAALFWLASWGLRRAAARRGVSYRYLFMHPSGADLTHLAGLIDAGRLEVVVDRSFAFAQADQALAYLETGRAKGKVVVRLPD